MLLLCQAPPTLPPAAGASPQPAKLQPPRAWTPSRRHLLALGGCTPLVLGARPAHAGLVQFPASQLNNTYVLVRAAPRIAATTSRQAPGWPVRPTAKLLLRSQVRAGESVAESQGYVLSNPVAKTSIDCGLSKRGIEQVCRPTGRETCQWTVDRRALAGRHASGLSAGPPWQLLVPRTLAWLPA